MDRDVANQAVGQANVNGTKLAALSAAIPMEWVVATAERPEHQRAQADGRLRRWRRIPEAGNRWLRVVLLADGITIHNAFFDRGFAP